jgi:FKBP-type peptidyl-prolyl cis-trans isomerase FklB
MKKILFVALALAASASLCTISAKGKKDKKGKTATEKALLLNNATDSLSYAAGMAMTDGLLPYLKQQYGINESQLADVARGFRDAMLQKGDTVFNAYLAGMQVAQMVDKRMLPGLKNDIPELNDEIVSIGFADAIEQKHTVYNDSLAKVIFEEGKQAATQKKYAQQIEAGERFLAENKTKPGVVTLPSGLQYKVLKQGTGALPKATDKVKVIYEGRTLDGNVFDATAKHGTESDTFGVSNLIKGWTEALLMMPVGSKWEVYIPQNLAYGERGAGRNIKPYETLIFTLELLGIE